MEGEEIGKNRYGTEGGKKKKCKGNGRDNPERTAGDGRGRKGRGKRR